MRWLLILLVVILAAVMIGLVSVNIVKPSVENVAENGAETPPTADDTAAPSDTTGENSSNPIDEIVDNVIASDAAPPPSRFPRFRSSSGVSGPSIRKTAEPRIRTIR